MAYQPRRRSSYRAAPARRTYGTRRRVSRAPARRRVAAGGRGSRQQTLKIVIENVGHSGIARPEGAPLQKIEDGPRKSKF